MRNLNEFLETLNKATYNEVDGNTLIGTINDKHAIKVSISTKLSESYHDLDNYPVQCIARVVINEQYVQSWGCMANEDNTLLVRWFQETKSKARNTSDKLEDKARSDAKIVFEKLKSNL